MLTGLSGASLWSEDKENLIPFYRDILGLRVLMVENDGYTVFGDNVNKGWLGIGTHSKVSGTAIDPYRHMIALGTTSVEEEFVRLKSKGVEFIEQPTDYGDGFWIATLKDPEGNVVQLFQAPVS